MAQIRRHAKSKNGLLVTKDIEGKKVIDRSGKEIGVVKAIHIDPITLHVEGITISKGLFNDSDYVGSEYITAITNKAALLSIVPITEYLGKKVFDSKGNELGKVKEIHRTNKTNNVLSITVDRGFLKQDLVVGDHAIDSIGENIRLNEAVEK
ncbi:PRC-barrel domain-containing protein [Candidatus Woesearchaeota archaeon]|nr:PRC-barrel domain-containing protein [Candidatus Woesearchaeota archaeon]